mmetsp:Transcript_27077/g.35503  ORF Transcript_27077/g.35503 Transcript_27077/m.35503 type:complete len:260 (-) Transcript_27077:80-859(-)
MEYIWEELLLAQISEAIESEGLFVLDNLFSREQMLQCGIELQEMDNADLLKPATITRGLVNDCDQRSRGDRVTFLKCDDLLEGAERLNKDKSGIQYHLRAMNALRICLENILQKGMEKSSFMGAIYPGDGSGYICHRDSSPDCPGRKLTVLFYLNHDWEESDGGQLVIYKDAADDEGNLSEDKLEPSITINPIGGRLVIFVSSMEHEVLPCYRQRMAITSWFYNRRDMAIELLIEQMQKQKVKQETNVHDEDDGGRKEI